MNPRIVRRTHIERWLFAAVFVANLAGAQTSPAGPAPADLQRARALFAEAEAFEGKSDWKEALDRLEQAFAIKSTPGIRFHIGHCQEKLGAKKTALEDYRRAAELAAVEKKDDVRKAAEDAIKRLLPTIPTVLIIPSVTGTTITIDKNTAAENVPFQVDAGRHSIRIEKEGFEPYTDSFSIAPEERLAKIEVRLHQRVQPLTKPNASAQATANASATNLNDAQAANASPAGSRSNTAAWLTTIGAVVLAGGGLTAYVLAGSSASGECRVTGDCESERSKVRVLDWTAASMWTAAAGLGIVSIVLWSKGAGDSMTASASRRIQHAAKTEPSRSIEITEAMALPAQGGISFALRGAFE